VKHTALHALFAIGIVSASLTARGADAPAAAPAGVEYPTGYRQWQHVKSMVIEPGHALYASFGGIHHLYANPAAVQGYGAGRFPDGAVIAFDLLEATPGGNAIVEGPRKVLGVMLKDSKRFAATGGWGFEAWDAGNPGKPVVGSNAATACFACHASEKSSDYVFSKMR
jgi:hypothetical protein